MAALLVVAAPFCGALPQLGGIQQQVPPVRNRNSGSSETRTIVGKVIDKSGALVPGAIVLLKNMNSLQVRSYIAQDGNYRFFGLDTDTPYELRAQTKEMTSDIKRVSVFSHNEITINLKLKKLKRKKNS